MYVVYIYTYIHICSIYIYIHDMYVVYIYIYICSVYIYISLSLSLPLSLEGWNSNHPTNHFEPAMPTPQASQLLQACLQGAGVISDEPRTADRWELRSKKWGVQVAKLGLKPQWRENTTKFVDPHRFPQTNFDCLDGNGAFSIPLV